MRKPHFHFGWDWAPRMTTAGIFKPVYVRAFSEARIVSTHFTHDDITQSNVDSYAIRVYGYIEIQAAQQDLPPMRL